ncbi:MAG: hypothetical protein J5871_07090 [Bacteroidales bacterium]|nr:hypothetical protein [Bacteroidales bacterium]
MEYGLIGEHLGHSFSPEIHNALGPEPYVLQEIPRGELAAFLRERPFKGINVTIPYKEAVLPWLDALSPTAQLTGAVNTIVQENGRLTGYNTDVDGFAALARHTGISLRDRQVVILGKGGAAKAVSVAARALGAKSILQAVRQPQGPEQIPLAPSPQMQAADVLVNATPVGMFPDGNAHLPDLGAMPALQGVLDCIYNPLQSHLVLDAREKGIPAAGGLYMLVAQACRARELFLSQELSPGTVDDAYTRLWSRKCNVVLCGMPSAGKSTVGRILAERTGRRFVDTDRLVEEKAGCRISAIFSREGEQAFRRLEAGAVAEISTRQGLVIATGGGTVLAAGNLRQLKMNGRIFLLQRSLAHLMPTQDRPLSRSREDLAALYRVRMPLYRQAADVCIDNDGDFERTMDALLSEILVDER